MRIEGVCQCGHSTQRRVAASSGVHFEIVDDDDRMVGDIMYSTLRDADVIAKGLAGAFPDLGSLRIIAVTETPTVVRGVRVIKAL